MKKANFTAERVAGFKCAAGKAQSIFWDGKVPGLGLRVTASGAKSYIFETRLHGKTIRSTIGDVRIWTIGKAQAEATELKALTDKGIDPRQLQAEKKAAIAAATASAERETVTLGEIWPIYIAERASHWGERHAADHLKMIKAGGEVRIRSKKKITEPAPLASLAGVRMSDLTAARVETWASKEGATRPTSARLALRMLKACLNWCAVHPIYSEIVDSNAAKSKKARETLGKSKPKNDVLQREQLPAWFAAVRQIGNPVISAYLQCLLLSGARRGELVRLQWSDCDFQWKSLTIRDKVMGLRVIPLPPYMEHILAALPRRNEWVFSSVTAAAGRLADPTKAHNQACHVAGLDVSLHGLRRSFASLCEWTETPAGIAAQIQGHAPQGVREQNYIRRPLDLLRMWHIKIEAWMLEQAGIAFTPADQGFKIVKLA